MLQRLRRSLPVGIVAGAAFLHTLAYGAPLAKTARRVELPARSIGAPNAGHLENGVHLDTSKEIRVVGAYLPGDARWGTRELVRLIERTAHEVRKRFPDAVLGVGHLSRKGGGEIERHASHESGRDADIAFYLTDAAGKPIVRDHFVAILPDGKAGAEAGVRFDDARNWAVVAALLTDPQAHVTHIFVASPLRTRLLAYAAKVGAPAAIRARAAELMMQPHHALPHDDHFHVRIACPGNSTECLEWPTLASRAHKASVGAMLAKDRAHPPPASRGKVVRARSTGRTNVVEPLPLATPAPPAIPALPAPSGSASPTEAPSEGPLAVDG
jgi:penicillin-insensitive murein endopeptidase